MFSLILGKLSLSEESDSAQGAGLSQYLNHAWVLSSALHNLAGLLHTEGWSRRSLC